MWQQKPGKHIFAFGSLLLPGFIAESSVASAGKDSVQGNGEASRAVEAVLCIAFYRVSLPGSRYQLLRGTISRNSGLDEPLAEKKYMIKVSACRSISQAFSQVSEKNTR